MKTTSPVSLQAVPTSKMRVGILCFIKGIPTENMIRANQSPTLSELTYEAMESKLNQLNYELGLPPEYSYYEAPKPISKSEQYGYVTVSTEVSVLKEYWDSKNKKLIGVAAKDNAKITAFKTAVELLYNRLKEREEKGELILTREMFKKAVEKFIKVYSSNDKSEVVLLEDKTPVNKPTPMIQPGVQSYPLWSSFITERIEKEIKKGKLSVDGRGSADQYEQFVRNIQEFELRRGKYIYCNQLSEKLLEDYLIFFRNDLWKIRERKTSYSLSTIDKEKKCFMKYAVRVAKELKLDIQPEDWEDLERQRKESTSKPLTYLTVDELERVEALSEDQLRDLNTMKVNPKNVDDYITIRNYFLLASWLGGKRISDYRKINLVPIPDDPGNYYAEDFSQKTNVYTMLACFPPVVRIWKKYKGKLPPVPNHFNSKLQEILCLAKVNSLVVVDKKGKRVPKYTLIKSHSGRDNFINNMIYHYKQNPLFVMQWAGIESEKVLWNHYLGNNVHTTFTVMRDLVKAQSLPRLTKLAS